MTVVLNNDFYKPLDEFFAKKTVHDANRDTYLVCNLHDKTNNIQICLVFLRDWDSLESDSFNQVIIENKGAVFTFPSYWVSVPKELAFPYFTYIIEAFYNEYASKWITNSGNSNSTNLNGGSNDNCNCCPPCGLNLI